MDHPTENHPARSAAAAADLRHQILERVSALRLEPNIPGKGASPIPIPATSILSGNNNSNGDLLEDGKVKQDDSAIHPLATPDSKRDNSKDSVKVPAFRDHFTAVPLSNGSSAPSGILLPSLTPLLPVDLSTEDCPETTFNQGGKTTSSLRPRINPKKRIKYVRTPPFPVPGGNFIGREGVKTPSQKFHESAENNFTPGKIGVTLSLPVFESENSNDVDHPKKKPRIHLPVRLAPRFNPLSRDGDSNSIPQDRTGPDQDVGRGNSFQPSNVPSEAFGDTSTSFNSPVASVPALNPSVSFTTTPVRKGRSQSLEAPVKHKSSVRGNKDARHRRQKAFGDVFDHQLSLLTVKPKDRFRHLSKKSPIASSCSKQPEHLDSTMSFEEGFSHGLTPVKCRLSEKYATGRSTTGSRYEQEETDSRDDEKLLTTGPTSFDEIETNCDTTAGLSQEWNVNKSNDVVTSDDLNSNQRPEEEESPFAAFEYDFFKA